MPRGEAFWNPYRWVPAKEQAVARAKPGHHHRWHGLAGRLNCTLEALTPLLIGDGRGQFVARTVAGKRVPFIPGTSLKGAIRSLAELVGNAAAPFPKARVDPAHQLEAASHEAGGVLHLDITARMFGYLHHKRVFAGLVRFSDALLLGAVPAALSFKVAGGAPDPDHRPFYPSNKARKVYHHKTGASELTPPHPGIKADQQRTVRPLPPGTTFAFTVDFENLGDEELSLLLYCLVLEERVTVTLSKEALGAKATDAVTFTGPMRHKLGGCKPQGGGSVHLCIDRMELRADPSARYRGASTAASALEGDKLREDLRRRTETIMTRSDPTMTHLRAMLIYAADDPRARYLNYPSYAWFQQDKQDGARTPLKPVL